MMNNESAIQEIGSRIVNLPGRPPAMLDRDLAEIYGTKTKRINEAVKRNPDRFPDDFMFQLTDVEAKEIKLQNVIPLNEDEWFRYLPYAYTHAGFRMMAFVLNNTISTAVALQVTRGNLISEDIELSEDKRYVYVMKGEGTQVKIGFSKSPDKRMIEIEKNGKSLIKRIFTSEPLLNYRETEKKLHKKFRKQHIKGEWYEVPFDEACAALKAEKTITDDADNRKMLSAKVRLILSLWNDFGELGYAYQRHNLRVL